MPLLRRSGCVQASVVRAGSCGLRSALRRSPYETYRLHHNIKASEYRVIGKPESKLSPQANAASEPLVSGAVGNGGRRGAIVGDDGPGCAVAGWRGGSGWQTSPAQLEVVDLIEISARCAPGVWRFRGAGRAYGLIWRQADAVKYCHRLI